MKPKRPTIRANAREQRVYGLSDVEVRTDDGEPPKIVGHAAVYNRWSEDLGGFKERVLPGAFTKTLVGGDIRSLFNHDPNYILGRTKSGTLTLTDGSKGLRTETTPPDTQTIRDLVIEPMRRGDVDQMSFSFRTVEDAWREPKDGIGLWERDLLEVKLYDISPVTFPAYPQTDVGLRSLLSEAGLDLEALTALLARAAGGLPFTDTDVDLLTGSIDVLRTYLPAEANDDESSGANPDEGSRSDAEGAAGATRARLIRELDHRLRIDHVAIPALRDIA